MRNKARWVLDALSQIAPPGESKENDDMWLDIASSATMYLPSQLRPVPPHRAGDAARHDAESILKTLSGIVGELSSTVSRLAEIAPYTAVKETYDEKCIDAALMIDRNRAMRIEDVPSNLLPHVLRMVEAGVLKRVGDTVSVEPL